MARTAASSSDPSPRTALVTGASSGIGEALAALFCRRRPRPGAGGAQRRQVEGPRRAAQGAARREGAGAGGRPVGARRGGQAGGVVEAQARGRARAGQQRRRAGTRCLLRHPCRAPPAADRSEHRCVDRAARAVRARDARARLRPRAERRLDRGVPAGAHAGHLRRDEGLRAVAERSAGRRTAGQRCHGDGAVPWASPRRRCSTTPRWAARAWRSCRAS